MLSRRALVFALLVAGAVSDKNEPWSAGSDLPVAPVGSTPPSISSSASPSMTTTFASSIGPTRAPSKPPTIVASTTPTDSSEPSPSPSDIATTPSSVPSSIPKAMQKASPSPLRMPSQSPTTAPSAQTVPSYVPSNGPSFSLSSEPTIVESELPSLSLQPTRKSSATPSSSPGPSGYPTANPTVDPSERPSNEPSLQSSSHPSLLPSLGPSSRPSSNPSYKPSILPSSVPTALPSFRPTEMPSETPTSMPSLSPTEVPSLLPSLQPTDVPSAIPTSVPSMTPSLSPTEVPSLLPSLQPTDVPSAIPTSVPSMTPSLSPTEVPSLLPSLQPTDVPSAVPTSVPSMAPSLSPTEVPSLLPSQQPSLKPSSSPSSQPSDIPTRAPSSFPTSSPSDEPSGSPSLAPSISLSPSISPTTSTAHETFTSVMFTASQLMDSDTVTIFESTTLKFVRANIELDDDYLVTVADVTVTNQTLKDSRRRLRQTISYNGYYRGLQSLQLEIDMQIIGDVWERRPSGSPGSAGMLFSDAVTKPLEAQYSEYLTELSEASKFFDEEVQSAVGALGAPVSQSSSGLEGPALIGMIVGLGIVAIGVAGYVVWRVRRHMEDGSAHGPWRVQGSRDAADSLSSVTYPSVRSAYRSSDINHGSPSDSDVYMKSNRSLKVSNRSFQVSQRDLQVTEVDSPSASVREPEGTTYAEIMKATEQYARMLSGGRSHTSETIDPPHDEDRYLSLHMEDFRNSLAPIGETETMGTDSSKRKKEDSFVSMKAFCALSPMSVSSEHRKHTPKQAKLEECSVRSPKGKFITKQSTPKGTHFVQLDTHSAHNTCGILDDLTHMESIWDGKLDSKVNSIAETPRANNLGKFHRPPKHLIYYRKHQHHQPEPSPFPTTKTGQGKKRRLDP